MKFYFSPNNDESFKKEAVNSFVRTLIFNRSTNKIHNCYSRKVSKRWEQSVKNNIESDHRVKGLPNGDYQIYSWVTKNELDFSLPCF